MAGLGRKTWAALEVMTAANTQSYLQDQTVMKYANTTAASSAVGTALSEGMQFYLSDTDEQVYHNGTTFAKQNGTTNAIINGAFDIWQRGTTSSTNGYIADRWNLAHDVNPTTYSQSQQTFTPGTAPVAGYEGTFFYRYTCTTVGSGSAVYVNNKIEDVRTFANQTVTASFWAKADSARQATISVQQNFGSGGSSPITVTSSAFSVTTSWQRFTATLTLASIAGKTIGTGSYLNTFIAIGTLASGLTLDIWGVQLEAGSVATPFKRNAPSIQAELAACQRYYWRSAGTAYANVGIGQGANTTSGRFLVTFPVEMRVPPTSTEFSTLGVTDNVALQTAVTGLITTQATKLIANVETSGSSGLTQYRPYFLSNQASTAGYIGFSAEL